MTTAIFSQIERGLTSVGSISKMAKFGSTASETISNLFHGSDLARAFGSVAKPLKKFADFTDLTSFLDPLNSLFVTSLTQQWRADKLKLLAKIALIAGLILTPIGFASSTLGLFSLGVLGTNIGTVGAMTGFTALKNGLILFSALYNVFDRRTAAFARKQGTENATLLREEALVKMYNALVDYRAAQRSADPAAINVRDASEHLFKSHARAANKTDADIQTIWKRFVAASDVEVTAQANHKGHVYLEKHYNAEKSRLTAIDDVNKVANLTITFVGAFVAAAVPGLAAVGALQLYSAYVGWQKSDAEVLANQEKVAIFNSNRDNAPLLQNWIIT